MKLTLSLREPQRVPGTKPTHTLVDGSMIIGRGSDADWSLHDPERLVSKAHCRIDAEPHGFVLTDVSTNGVLVNDEPLGFQSRRLLASSDLLRLGNVEIGVLVHKGAPEAPAPDFVSDGPFGNESSASIDAASLLSAALQETASGNDSSIGSDGPIKEDWLAAPTPPTTTKAVDIVDRTPAGRTQTASAGQPAISSADAIVISLVQSFPSLDVPTLAYAVDTAGAVIPEDSWQSFYERLRIFLREKYPDDA